MNEQDINRTNNIARAADISMPQVRVKATSLLAGFFLLSLVIPTIYVLPSGFGALSRSLEEFWDFAVIGAWLFLSVCGYTKKVSIQPKYLRWSLWILPIAVFISIFFHAFVGSPKLNDVYAILFALRPIAIIQITGLILWFGKVGERSLRRAIDLIFMIVGIGLVFVSLVAILQALRVTSIFMFVERFYGNEILFQGEMIQRSLQAIEYYNRTTSIFPWANHYGTYTAVSLLLLIHYFIYKTGLKRYLLAVPMLFGVVGLVLSGSRTSFLILFLGLLLTILIRRQFRLLPLLAVGAVLVVIAFTYSTLILGSNPRVIEIVDYVRGVGPIPKTFTARFENYALWLSGFYYQGGNLLTGMTVGVYDAIREIASDKTVRQRVPEVVYFVWYTRPVCVYFIRNRIGVVHLENVCQAQVFSYSEISGVNAICYIRSAQYRCFRTGYLAVVEGNLPFIHTFRYLALRNTDEQT